MSDIDIGQPDLSGLCVTGDAESAEAGSGLVNGYSLATGQPAPVARDLPAAGVDRTIRVSTAVAVLAVAATSMEAFEPDGPAIREYCAADPGLGYELNQRISKVLARRPHATRIRLIARSGHPAAAP